MNDHEDEDFEFLTIGEAAARLRIPIATLRWYRSQRRGPRSFKLGRRVHYDKRELRRWIEAQREDGATP
jgi:predicted DNA-binding transcriptional regulator AlpA